MFDLILLGGTICTPHGQYQADIAVQNGVIGVISSSLSKEDARQKLDVSSQYILPGCIDSHMHLWEPGFAAGEDFKDATLAAVAGGITTIIDQPLSIPAVLNVEILKKKIALGERTSYTDFALHGGVGLDNLDHLANLWQAGCTAFKIFMCESGSEVAGLYDGNLLAAFQKIGSFGGTVLLHAENQSMLDYNWAKLQDEGRTDFMAFVEWRSPESEIEAIHRALHLLKGSGARGIFLHTTVPEGVELIQAARQAGQDVWVETCPHNLYLSTDDLKEMGPWVTYSPPVRDPARVTVLWDQMNKGWIQLMGSDHNPIDIESKKPGETNIFEGQGGIPSVETMVPLMIDAVLKGKITLERVVDLMAEMPARMYGLFPQKGVIQVGSDADFTIVDMSKTHILKADEILTSCRWIPYESWRLEGKVTHTIIHGEIVMQANKILGYPGFGRFLQRKSVK